MAPPYAEARLFLSDQEQEAILATLESQSETCLRRGEKLQEIGMLQR